MAAEAAVVVVGCLFRGHWPGTCRLASLCGGAVVAAAAAAATVAGAVAVGVQERTWGEGQAAHSGPPVAPAGGHAALAGPRRAAAFWLLGGLARRRRLVHRRWARRGGAPACMGRGHRTLQLTTAPLPLPSAPPAAHRPSGCCGSSSSTAVKETAATDADVNAAAMYLDVRCAPPGFAPVRQGADGSRRRVRRPPRPSAAALRWEPPRASVHNAAAERRDWPSAAAETGWNRPPSRRGGCRASGWVGT